MKGWLSIVLGALLCLVVAAPASRAQGEAPEGAPPRAQGAGRPAALPPPTPESKGVPATPDIAEVVSKLASAFNSHNAAAYADLFVPDGEVTNLVGMTTTGRANIQRHFADLFSGVYKSVQFDVTPRNVHMPSETVAVFDADAKRMGGGPNQVWSFVLVKRGATWQIATLHYEQLGNPTGPTPKIPESGDF